MVNALLSDGADPNCQDDNGFTPLMYAAWSGKIEMVQALLNADAEINTPNKFGSTAIFWAAEAGHYEVVRLLILKGADLLVVNQDRQNPRIWAEYHDHQPVADLIHRGMLRQIYHHLKYDCSINQVRHLIEIQHAHQISKEDVVSYLLNTRAEPAEKLNSLWQAIACNAQGRPSTALSVYLHHSQGYGFKRFFTFERSPSYAVCRIRAEIRKLSALTIDMGPKLL
jgi:hypothetical protein